MVKVTLGKSLHGRPFCSYHTCLVPADVNFFRSLANEIYDNLFKHKGNVSFFLDEDLMPNRQITYISQPSTQVG